MYSIENVEGFVYVDKVVVVVDIKNGFVKGSGFEELFLLMFIEFLIGSVDVFVYCFDKVRMYELDVVVGFWGLYFELFDGI